MNSTVSDQQTPGVIPDACDVVELAEQLAASLHLLASFLRANPQVAETLRYTLDTLKIPLVANRDEELRRFVSAAHEFGLPVHVDTAKGHEHLGLVAMCGKTRLEVYGNAAGFSRPMAEYLTEVSA